MIKVLICDGDGTLQIPNPSREIKKLLLHDLRELGIRLAVVSNKPNQFQIKQSFQASDLPEPQIIVCQGDIHKKKPAPDFVNRVCEEAGVKHSEVLYLGDDDKTDAFCAINARVLPFSAHYSNARTKMEYGIPFLETADINRYLRSFGSQNDPYLGWTLKSRCSDTEKDIYFGSVFGSHGEIGLTNHLKSFFKENNRRWFNLNFSMEILFHFFLSQVYLSGIARKIDWITVYPGHQRDSHNPVLEEFSGYLTKVFKQQFKKDLIVRHTDAVKSQSMPGGNRNIFNQFSTLKLNSKYRGKLTGKTVLVLDDFTTSGCSLEAARRLLLQGEAKNVICLAMAKYRHDHTLTTINKSWDPFDVCDLDSTDISTHQQYGDIHSSVDHYFKDTIMPAYQT